MIATEWLPVNTYFDPHVRYRHGEAVVEALTTLTHWSTQRRHSRHLLHIKTLLNYSFLIVTSTTQYKQQVINNYKFDRNYFIISNYCLKTATN